MGIIIFEVLGAVVVLGTVELIMFGVASLRFLGTTMDGIIVVVVVVVVEGGSDVGFLPV